MNNYQKLLLKLNKQLEKYRNRKASLEKRKTDITSEIAEHQNKYEIIEEELKNAEIELKLNNLSVENAKKNIKAFKFSMIALFIILGIINLSMFHTGYLFLTATFGLFLVLSPILYIAYRVSFGGLEYSLDENTKLLEKQKELNEELDRIRSIIVDLNTNVEQIQYDYDIGRIDTVISRLEADINYIVEQEYIAISQVVMEQEPRINANFDSNERLKLIRENSLEEKKNE